MSKEQLFRKCFEKAAGNAARGGQALTNAELGSLSDAFENKVIEGRKKRLALTDAVLEARGTANTRKTTAMLEQYRTAQNILKIAELHGYAEANRGKHGSVPESILRNFEDYQDEKSGTVSARGLALAINAESARAMDGAIHYMGTKWYGLKDSAEKTFKLLQEMHGVDSGDPAAKAAAKGLIDRMEELRRNANRLGANIGKVAATYIPQSHAFWKIAAGSHAREVWVNHVMPLLDRSRYRDELTDTPWNDAKMKDFLQEAWWTLSTQGSMKPESGAKFGGVANRFSQERQIHFQRDPAAWLAYHEKYGSGETLLHMIEAKMHGMANQVSLLQKFGPSMQANVNAVLNLEKARLGKAADTDGATKFNADKNRLDGAMNDMTVHKPIQNRKIQEGFQSLRNVMAWRLGAATITAAPSDAATMMIVARANQASGLGAVVNTLRSIAKYNSDAGRVQIQNAGLQAQALHQRFAETAGQMATSRITKYASDVIIKLGGLMQWTRAAREGFNLSLSNTIGHLVDRADYSALNKEDARWLRQYGVDEKSFGLWKAAQKQDWGHGEKLLTADAIRNVPDAAVRKVYANEIAKGAEAAKKMSQGGNLEEARAAQELDTYRTDAARHFLAVVHSESLGAVVEPRPNVQRMVKGAPGTWKGELWNTAMQFKSFPLATLGEHFWQRGIKAGRYGYVPAYLGAMLVAGVVSKTVADLIIGKEPPPFFNFEHPQALTKAWMQAFAKSGGLGIYGDLLLSDQKDASQAIVNAAAGPAVGDAASIMTAYLRAKSAGSGEQASRAVLSQLINVGKSYIPGSSLWFVRGIFNHAVVQNAQESVNPGYLQRIQARAERDQQPYFWAPGQTVPQNGPTLEHVAE